MECARLELSGLARKVAIWQSQTAGRLMELTQRKQRLREWGRSRAQVAVRVREWRANAFGVGLNPTTNKALN